MAISFEAIGQKMVTFAAGTGLAEGKAGEVVPGTSGRTCLIVSVDSTNKKIGLFL